jgi:LPS export ABC transporter protein LptC
VVNGNHNEELVEHPDHESWDVRITITNAGTKRAYIEADYLEQYNNKNIISLKNNVKIDFYDADENLISNLSADEAEINERTNFLLAMNNIIIKSDSGVTLFTDTLSWDNTRELIFTDDSVMITTETNDTLYGIGFESDINMERWKILKPRGVTSR